jgi:cytochrome c peroxidase
MKSKIVSLLVLAAAFVSSLALGQTGALVDPVAEERDIARHLSPKVLLGRILFNDARLSEPAGQSCATCHDARFASTDPDKRSPTSQGVNLKLFGNRNTPTAMYMAFSPAFHFDEVEGLYLGGQFLDGRAATLEEQAKGPFLNPLEMANTSKYQVVEKVRTAEYAPLFKRVFGSTVFGNTEEAYNKIAEAIAAFERTRAFNKFTSKYDAWLAGKATLSAQEMRGLKLFEDPTKGNCAACHPSQPGADGSPPLFTDFSYDNLGVPRNPHNRFYKMSAEFNPAGWNFVDKGLGGFLGLAAEDGKFKVPTLRNIAVTSPYMHNGYFKTLTGAVDFYNTRDTKPACGKIFLDDEKAISKGCWPVAEVTDNVNVDELGNLGLNSQEVNDIVAFMQTLTDGWMRVFGK